jgi:hypothetical protein
VNNITVALRALAPVLIAWPNEQERLLLKDYYKRHYFWGNVDNVLSLSFCPSICGGDYFDRYFIPKPLFVNITPVFFFPHFHLENRITASTSNLLWTQMLGYDIGLAVYLDLHMILGVLLIPPLCFFSATTILVLLFGCCKVHFDNHECRYGRMNILVKASIC